MTVNGLPAGAVPLGPQKVSIHKFTALPIASIEWAKGGLGFPTMDCHMRLADIPHGEMFLVPMSSAFLATLAQQATLLLDTHYE